MNLLSFTMSDNEMSCKTLMKTIKKVFRENVLIAFILQIFAISIVVMFYTIDNVEKAFDHIGDLKNDGGYWFSGTSTMIFGGIIPYLIFMIKGKYSTKDLLFACIYWFLVGLIADTLYRGMNFLFGDEVNFETVAIKASLDQFVWNPLVGVHNMVIPYYWKDVNYSFSKLKGLFTKLYFYKIISTLIALWIVWVPCVSAVYSMPPNLQIVLFNIVVLFYSIVLESLSSKTTHETIQYATDDQDIELDPIIINDVNFDD